MPKLKRYDSKQDFEATPLKKDADKKPMELFQVRVQASTPVFKRLLNQVEIAQSLRISKGNNRKKKMPRLKWISTVAKFLSAYARKFYSRK